MNISINNYTKNIKNSIVLDSINLDFTDGNIYGIVGRNGSGKSMLLRAISGMIVPTSGKVFVDGKALHNDIDFPPDMGLLIGKTEFLNHLSGLANLQFLSRIKNLISVDTIIKYMELFELDYNSKKPLKKYSDGMKQKIGIIQSLMEDPKLLVLDEPFNALDEKSVNTLRDLLIDMKTDGKLIIITSHNKEDIEFLCDHTIIIDSGQIK